MARARSAKFEIDKNRKAKAAEKRQRRQQRGEPATAAEPGAVAAEPVDASSVMDQLSALHVRFADGDIEFEEFEQEKAELLARLVD